MTIRDEKKIKLLILNAMLKAKKDYTCWKGIPLENYMANEVFNLFKDYRNINEPIMKRCDECKGKGYFPVEETVLLETCPTCKGEGEVPVMVEVECFCSGGFLPNGDECNCNEGKITRPKTLGDLVEEEKRKRNL